MTTPRPEALTAEEASFLRWCHERFQIVFRESPNLDWMRRLWRVSEAVDDAARAARPERGLDVERPHERRDGHICNPDGPCEDAQTTALLAALDARNVHSAGDLERYDRQGLDIQRLTVAIHGWQCGETVKHGDKGRPHIGWICERGAKAVAAGYARLAARLTDGDG